MSKKNKDIFTASIIYMGIGDKYNMGNNFKILYFYVYSILNKVI